MVILKLCMIYHSGAPSLDDGLLLLMVSLGAGRIKSDGWKLREQGFTDDILDFWRVREMLAMEGINGSGTPKMGRNKGRRINGRGLGASKVDDRRPRDVSSRGSRGQSSKFGAMGKRFIQLVGGWQFSQDSVAQQHLPLLGIAGGEAPNL